MDKQRATRTRLVLSCSGGSTETERESCLGISNRPFSSSSTKGWSHSILMLSAYSQAYVYGVIRAQRQSLELSTVTSQFQQWQHMLGVPTTHTPTSAGLVPRSSSNPASPHTCRSGTAQSCACAIIGGNQCPRAPSCAVRMPDGSNNSGKSAFVPSLSERVKRSPGSWRTE